MTREEESLYDESLGRVMYSFLFSSSCSTIKVSKVQPWFWPSRVILVAQPGYLGVEFAPGINQGIFLAVQGEKTRATKNPTCLESALVLENALLLLPENRRPLRVIHYSRVNDDTFSNPKPNEAHWADGRGLTLIGRITTIIYQVPGVGSWVFLPGQVSMGDYWKQFWNILAFYLLNRDWGMTTGVHSVPMEGVFPVNRTGAAPGQTLIMEQGYY